MPAAVAVALVLGISPAVWAASPSPSPSAPPPAAPLPRQASDFFVPAEGSPTAGADGLFRAASPVPGGAIQEGLVAVYDLSEIADKVRIVRADDGCGISDDRVTCRTGSDGHLSDTPFSLVARPSAALGYAGVVTVRHTGRPGLPPAASTRIHIGVPKFGARALPDVTMPVTSALDAAPSIRPAFVNTGGPTPGTVLLKIWVVDTLPRRDKPALRFSRDFGNCHYAESGTHVYCEFAGPVRPGQWYTTGSELRAVNERCCQVQGMYQYVVSPVEVLTDSEIASYRAMPKGSGPPLGLQETQATAVVEGASASMRFRSQDAPAGLYFGERSVTIAGAVGDVARIEIPRPAATEGFPATADEVRVELPRGTSLAPTPKPGSFPSEEGWCSPADRTSRKFTCPRAGDRTMLAVRIDREVPGARGRVWVPVPPGDTAPSDNSVPIEMVVNGGAGTAPASDRAATPLAVAALLAAACGA
ncbi:hypothetical protein ACFV0Q_28575, partial [Streptomyces sp. NPDC059564]